MKSATGYGQFTWDGEERRSNRYGSFVLDNLSDPIDPATLDLASLEQMRARRVKIACKVVKTRPSHHVGDLFLGIQPSTPEVGEVITLGVGGLVVEPCDWAPHKVALVLAPEDHRPGLWMDPRLLYRLHDQTVEMLVEETDEPCSAAPNLSTDAIAEGARSNGDNSFQVKGALPADGDTVAPRIEPLGGGVSVDFSFARGQRIDLRSRRRT